MIYILFGLYGMDTVCGCTCYATHFPLYLLIMCMWILILEIHGILGCLFIIVIWMWYVLAYYLEKKCFGILLLVWDSPTLFWHYGHSLSTRKKQKKKSSQSILVFLVLASPTNCFQYYSCWVCVPSFEHSARLGLHLASGVISHFYWLLFNILLLLLTTFVLLFTVF